MEEELRNNKKRVRVDSDESELVDSSYVKRLREDLLNNLDDSSDLGTGNEDLDSFMKSFEEEISGSPKVVDLTSDSGESQPDLGYLLEASDDELGLPPSTASPSEVSEGIELVRDEYGLGELWGFDEQIPNYDSFEFGIGEVDGNSFNGNGEYVGFDDGLFDDTDYLWRPETLPTQ